VKTWVSNGVAVEFAAFEFASGVELTSKLMKVADPVVEVVLFTPSNERVGTIVALTSDTFDLVDEVTDPVVEFIQCILLDRTTVLVVFVTGPETIEDVTIDTLIDEFK
jgi:hypothetical protein